MRYHLLHLLIVYSNLSGLIGFKIISFIPAAKQLYREINLYNLVNFS